MSVSPSGLVCSDRGRADGIAAQWMIGSDGAQQLPTDAESLLGVQRVRMFQ
jgi:hypothetical protein